MTTRGKNYKDSAKLIDRTNLYEAREAVELILQTAKAKFDETIEAHIKLGVDSRHADQQKRRNCASSWNRQIKKSTCIC
jgi:large subunit ribosomal protein L1